MKEPLALASDIDPCPETFKVDLAFALSHQHLVRMLRGIEQFARERGNWAFTFNPEEFGGSIAGLQRWPGDGIISTVITRREARIAHETSLPVVNLSGALRDAGLPRVMVDHEAVGRLAAEHLLERGFQRFGYFGVRGVWWSQQLKHGFVHRLKEAGGGGQASADGRGETQVARDRPALRLQREPQSASGL